MGTFKSCFVICVIFSRRLGLTHRETPLIHQAILPHYQEPYGLMLMAGCCLSDRRHLCQLSLNHQCFDQHGWMTALDAASWNVARAGTLHPGRIRGDFFQKFRHKRLDFTTKGVEVSEVCVIEVARSKPVRYAALPDTSQLSGPSARGLYAVSSRMLHRLRCLAYLYARSLSASQGPAAHVSSH